MRPVVKGPSGCIPLLRRNLGANVRLDTYCFSCVQQMRSKAVAADDGIGAKLRTWRIRSGMVECAPMGTDWERYCVDSEVAQWDSGRGERLKPPLGKR